MASQGDYLKAAGQTYVYSPSARARFKWGYSDTRSQGSKGVLRGWHPKMWNPNYLKGVRAGLSANRRAKGLPYSYHKTSDCHVRAHTRNGRPVQAFTRSCRMKG